MAAVIQYNGAGAQAFRHTAVMIQSMNKAADFENRLAHGFPLFAR